MSSDQGWTAPLYMLDGTVWYVKREVPDWERCQDGTAFSGQQTYYFYPVDSIWRIHSRGADLRRKGQDRRPERCLRAKRVAYYHDSVTPGQADLTGRPRPQVGSMSCHVLGAFEVARSDCW